MDAVNIAENETTIFISIEKNMLNEKLLYNLNKILQKDFINKNIEFVSDKEQKDIEGILNSMTEKDKEIALSKRITI